MPALPRQPPADAWRGVTEGLRGSRGVRQPPVIMLCWQMKQGGCCWHVIVSAICGGATVMDAVFGDDSENEKGAAGVAATP